MNERFNLIPETVLFRNLFWVRVRQWSVGWCIVMFVGLMGIGFHVSQIAVMRLKLNELTSSTQPIRDTQVELEKRQQRLNVLYSHESLLTMLDRIEQPLQILGIIGRSSVSDRPDIQVKEFQLSPIQVPESVETFDQKGQQVSTTRMTDRVQLKVAGLGVDDLAVARFVAGLREATVFDTVSLKSSARAESLPVECRQFAVECVFQ
ncbi:MAG: hypothetical protein FJ267_13980 [Planctomycetes bacterium]|nr:hypothetical protein [Planctomycetota bacterium]